MSLLMMARWMACYWTAPSHYLNQGWLIVDWTIRNKSSEILITTKTFQFKIMHLEMSSVVILLGPVVLKCTEIGPWEGTITAWYSGQDKVHIAKKSIIPISYFMHEYIFSNVPSLSYHIKKSMPCDFTFQIQPVFIVCFCSCGNCCEKNYRLDSNSFRWW